MNHLNNRYTILPLNLPFVIGNGWEYIHGIYVGNGIICLLHVEKMWCVRIGETLEEVVSCRNQ
jgi:hypothetical protein